jgi:hypothetical protein
MNPYDKSLRVQGFILAGMLAVQYVLGMYVNLFVKFPDNSTQSQLWEFAWSQPALVAHILIAFALLFGSIALCIRAARHRPTVWIWPSLIGLLALVAAGLSGASFVPTQTDLYSYSMSIAFIIAFCAYAWGIYVTGRDAKLL